MEFCTHDGGDDLVGKFSRTSSEIHRSGIPQESVYRQADAGWVRIIL